MIGEIEFLYLSAVITDINKSRMTNAEIAYRFEQVARLLTEQRANLYRVRAYRRAAEILRPVDRQVEEILQHEGEAGL